MASRAVAIVAVAIALVVVAGDVNAQGTTVVAVCVSPPEEVTDSRVKGEMYVWRASIVSALVTELRTSADVCSAVMSFGFWTGSRPMIDYILTERVGCYIAGEFTKPIGNDWRIQFLIVDVRADPSDTLQWVEYPVADVNPKKDDVGESASRITRDLLGSMRGINPKKGAKTVRATCFGVPAVSRC